MKMLFALITILIEMNFQICFGNNSSIIEAQMDFALNLLRASSDSGHSTVISPFLVSYNFAMVYSFAEGDTKHEIEEVLAKGQDQHSFKDYLDNVVSLRNSMPYAYPPIFHMKNQLVVHDGISLSHDFTDTITDYFSTELVKSNFVPVIEELLKEAREQRDQYPADQIDDPPAVCPRSAYWLNMLTNYHQWHNLSDFDASVNTIKPVLLSINDVDWIGTWEYEFNSHNTENRPFFLLPNEQSTVIRAVKQLPMMQRSGYFAYYEDNEVQTVVIWFSDHSSFMLIILPKNTYGLADLEKNLDGQKIAQYINAELRFVKVVLPKFSLECHFSLADSLTRLGLRTTFNEAANFSGISSHHRIFIPYMAQTAKIQVNENGAKDTEFDPAHHSLVESQIVADHSFLFAVFDYSKVILLNGRFTGTD